MSQTPTYSERLGVPLRWWVQGTMLVATLWLAVVVALPAVAAWIITAVAMAVLSLGLWAYGAARITVDTATFRAGRAHIDVAHIGDAIPLDAGQTRRIAGMDADARAYLLLRPYLKRAVRVEITDPADPAPYWLVSTRRPEELADALGALSRPSKAEPTEH
ncbi:DUF3093 domain-containing protein [Nocardioides endophyticus]|uniref:DUF3093 domain-containing protein n=1 Tax=Nocardioides endophyticus TaxID=1353775 RepID=A0ABP8Z0R0_9ACTN